MSETLGEKLRNARENRGISISQVSEQTRIASHHLNAIEENDFSGLPGGIFNKGFVRSFAKCVGIDEQEALNDYNALMSAREPEPSANELYSPEVLTDERMKPSMASTVVLVVIILAVLIAGLMASIYWLSDDGGKESEASLSPAAESSAARQIATEPVQTPTPTQKGFSVEIAGREKILEFSYEVDGEKIPVKILKPGETLSLEPKESFRGSFYRSVVPSVSLRINGQEISLARPAKQYLDITVNNDNVAEIVSGKSLGDPAPEPQSTPGANRTDSTNRPAGRQPQQVLLPPPSTSSPAVNVRRPDAPAR